jgi:hypothetical protein
VLRAYKGFKDYFATDFCRVFPVVGVPFCSCMFFYIVCDFFRFTVCKVNAS